MLAEPEGLGNTYFCFSPVLVPNLSGHVFLCLFNSFLPSYVAEKLVMIVYIVSLPVCFRLLIRQLKPDAIWYSYLIFPFIYSSLFYQGFFNFCLGLPLHLLTLVYWFKIKERVRLINVFVLFLLFFALYASHLVVFLMTVLSIMIFISGDFVPAIFKKEIGKNGNPFLRQLVVVCCAALPWLIFSLHYYQNSLTGVTMLETKKKLSTLVDVEPLLTMPYLKWIFALLFLIAIINRWGIKKEKKQDGWLLLLGVELILLIFMPDQVGMGSFILTRIILFIYLLVVIWIAVYAPSRPVIGITIWSLVIMNGIIVFVDSKKTRQLNKVAMSYAAAGELIPENSLVLPLNYSNELITSNLSAYLSSEKKVLLLDNYEALTLHFPLRWKKELQLEALFTGYLQSSTPRVDILAYEKQLGQKIDYVVCGFHSDTINDSSTVHVNRQLAALYEPVLKKDFVKLYKRK